MEKEKVQRLFELESEKRKILKNLRKILGITDPNFRPIETQVYEGDPSLHIIPETGKIIKILVDANIYFNTGKTKCGVSIKDPGAGQKWIDGEISKLNKIDKEINDL